MVTLNPSKHFDIIIVGGGLAGSSLALLLSKHLKILVLEKSSLNFKKELEDLDFSPTSKTIALSHASYAILARLGLWEMLESYATPIQNIHVSEENAFNKVRISAKELNLPALGYVFEGQKLAYLLQKQTFGQSHILWNFVEKISLIQWNKDNISLSYKNEGKIKTVTAHLLIAADGKDSWVRTNAQCSIEERSYEQTAWVTHVELSESHQNQAFERFGKDFTIAFLPLSEKKGTVILSLPNFLCNHLLNKEEKIYQYIQNKLPFLKRKIINFGVLISYPLVKIHALKSYQHRLILLGNAAHHLHPVAAQGFNLALRDIEVLAQKINHIDFKDTQASFDTPIHTLGFEYTQARASDQKQIYFFTELLQSLFMSKRLSFRLLKNFAMLSINYLPYVKTYFARRCAGILG